MSRLLTPLGQGAVSGPLSLYTHRRLGAPGASRALSGPHPEAHQSRFHRQGRAGIQPRCPRPPGLYSPPCVRSVKAGKQPRVPAQGNAREGGRLQDVAWEHQCSLCSSGLPRPSSGPHSPLARLCFSSKQHELRWKTWTFKVVLLGSSFCWTRTHSGEGGRVPVVGASALMQEILAGIYKMLGLSPSGASGVPSVRWG